MTSRDVGDISTMPGGRTGAEWTTDTWDSLLALWALNGGVLLGVGGTNVISAAVAVADGFTAYSDGLRFGFRPAATNTGAATINISGVGAKALRDPDGNVLQAGAIVAGRYTEIIFLAASDHFRLVSTGGTTNVTVQGGLMVQRSAPARLVSPAGPATASTVVVSLNFQATYSDSRVVLEGSIGRLTGSGVADDDGAVIALYVDGSLAQSFTEYCQPSALVNTPFYFSHLPADAANHLYEIRASATISTTYSKGSSVIWASEISPNS